MDSLIGAADLRLLAPLGYYLALRVGFAFPMEEINALPQPWIEHYTRQRFMMKDPVIHWIYGHTGAIRWSEIPGGDPHHVMTQARAFGLKYGVAISYFDNNPEGRRSYGSFVRQDREFSDAEIALLHEHVIRRHEETVPPDNLTPAEIEALRMVKEGKRLKEIAHALRISEGAVKQRLKNAKVKLGASTGAQAATMASGFGLI